MYAAVLFVVAVIQSICVHQFFIKCMVVGMRLRTAVMSIVYKKVGHGREGFSHLLASTAVPHTSHPFACVCHFTFSAFCSAGIMIEAFFMPQACMCARSIVHIYVYFKCAEHTVARCLTCMYLQRVPVYTGSCGAVFTSPSLPTALSSLRLSSLWC